MHLPNYGDLDRLPYIRAVLLETLRWMIPTPIGLPHVVNADDVYEGYDIPKGSLLVTVRIYGFTSFLPLLMCYPGFRTSGMSMLHRLPRRFN